MWDARHLSSYFDYLISEIVPLRLFDISVYTWRTTMGSFERTEFPEIKFTEALEILEKIRTKSIKTIPSLALEMGYSAKAHGGSFFYKRSALSKHFGLLEPSKMTVTLTRLGERIVHPLNEADRANAMREAVTRVPLLKGLFDRLGTSYHQDDFRPALEALTGASPAEVEAASKQIEIVYADAISYFKGPSTPSLTRPQASAPAPEGTSPATGAWVDKSSSGGAEIPSFEGPVRNLHSEDGYFIRVRLDPEVIQEAIDVLNALKARAEKKADHKEVPLG